MISVFIREASCVLSNASVPDGPVPGQAALTVLTSETVQGGFASSFSSHGVLGS